MFCPSVTFVHLAEAGGQMRWHLVGTLAWLQVTSSPSALSLVSVQHVRDILGVETLKELFEIVESRNIVAFIKDTHFYHCV